jgi:Mg/Co/Ni transporter MgtE
LTHFVLTTRDEVVELMWSGSPGLCVVIATSTMVSMVLAAFAGAVIPMLLMASGRDPATASSIVLTT